MKEWTEDRKEKPDWHRVLECHLIFGLWISQDCFKAPTFSINNNVGPNFQWNDKSSLKTWAEEATSFLSSPSQEHPITGE